MRATTGLIKPPTSSGQYLPNQNCTWYISVTSGTSVRLTFARFNLEASNSCQNDYVLIRNGHAPDSPILGRYCGSSLPSPIVASNNIVSVQFVTNSINQLSGFLLNYTQFVRGMIVLNCVLNTRCFIIEELRICFEMADVMNKLLFFFGTD